MLFLSYLLYVVSAHDSLGRFWELIVLTIIGETMDESDNICGARILDKVKLYIICNDQSKPQKKQIAYRLEIWFKDWNDEEFKNRLQKKVEEICRSFHYDKADISFMKHDAGKWN